MSDVLKELQVALSLDTSDFSNNTKKMNNHINDMQAKFKAASLTVEGFENSFTGLNAKSKILETTIEKNKTQLANLRDELAKNKAKTEDLKNTYDSAKTTYESNARALEALKNSGTATAEEINKLEKEVEQSKQAFLKAESAYSRNQDKIAKLGTSITKTETNLIKLNNQNEITKNKLNALQNPVLTTEQKLQNLATKTSLVESKMKLLTSQLGVNAKAVDKLKVSEQNLASKLDLVSQKVSILKSNSSDLSAKKAALQSKARDLQRELANEEAALQKASNATNVNDKEVAELTANVLELKDKLRNTNTEIDKTTNEINQNNTALNNAQAEFNQLSTDIAKTKGELAALPFKNLSSTLDSISSKLRTVGQGLVSAGSSLTRYVTTPILALGTISLKTSLDFEQSMKEVQAISGATGDELLLLTEKAKYMGQTTKFTAIEASEAFNYMAMAGWTTSDMLNGIEGVMNLAAASGEDLATVSDICTDALTAFGLAAGDSTMFADVLARASADTNTNVAMMGETFKYVAPVAGALGFTIQDTAVAIGLMANAGIKSSMAGTSLRKIMTSLGDGVEIAGDKLGKYTVETTNADGSMREFNDILVDLRYAFSQLTESEAAATAEAIAGKTGMAGLLTIVQASDDDFNKLTESVNNCSGASKEMADIMMDTAKGDLTLLKSKLEALAINIGDKLAPVLIKIVDKISELADWFGNLSDEQQLNIMKWAGLAAAVGPLLVLIGKMSIGLSNVFKAGSLLSGGIGNLVGKLATTQAATAATTTAINGVASTATATGGVFTKIAPLLTNPWVLAGAAVVGATAVIVSETKKQKENIEKMAKDNKEAIHGLEERYASLSEGIEESISNIRNSSAEWITPETKANLVQDMKDIQKIIDGEGGNAEKEISELVSNVKSIWGKLTPDMKTQTTEAISNMIETFVRDGSLMPEKAKELIESIQKELDVELHLNMEGIENDLKLEGIYNRMGESLQKAVGWFGVNEIFGDIDDAARDIVSNVVKEFEGMDNIDTNTFFTRITSQLKEVGASSSQQADIIKNTLKPSLIETFGGEGAAKYIDNYINAFYSASEAPQALTEALQYANREYAYLTLDQQLALDDMNTQLIEKLGVQSEIMSGSVQDMLSQSSECWAGMVGNQLLASDNMEADLTTFTAGAVAQIANMSDDLEGQMQAAEWFNTFISRLVETGAISTEQAQTMANAINGALNKEVLTTSKLDATQFDSGIKTSLGKINELTGKIANPSSLLDDKKFNETETALKKKIDDLNKSKAKPEVIAEATQALSDLRLLKERIDALYDKTVTIKEKRITEYQTVYTQTGYAAAQRSVPTPQVSTYSLEADNMLARASVYTDNLTDDYQISGGYYSRTTSPNLVSPVEEAILKAIKSMTKDKETSSKTLTQNITINSPNQLSPREIARETRLAGQKLIRLY